VACHHPLTATAVPSSHGATGDHAVRT
jgi:hypothetical protein